MKMNNVTRGCFLAACILAALLVSCDEDNRATVDASTGCDCEPAEPAEPAEPPLAGRIVSLRDSREIPADRYGDNLIACDPGGILLGGSCDVESLGRVLLVKATEASEGSTTWICGWFNDTAEPVVVTAVAKCLMEEAPESP